MGVCGKLHTLKFYGGQDVAEKRFCLHCGVQLKRKRKSFCSIAHWVAYTKVKNAVVTYSDIKCWHCGEFIPAATQGRVQNKLFCNVHHQREYRLARRPEKPPQNIPHPPRLPRYCERPGCENPIPTANRRYCCLEHTPPPGVAPKYTEAQAGQVRELFFSGQHGLRDTATVVGVTLGTVVRIVYQKSPGWVLTKKPKRKPERRAI